MLCVICNQNTKTVPIHGKEVCINCKAAYYKTSHSLLNYICKTSVLNFRENKQTIIQNVYRYLNEASNCKRKNPFSVNLFCSFLPTEKVSCRFCRYRTCLLVLKKFPKLRLEESKVKSLYTFLSSIKNELFEFLEDKSKEGGQKEVKSVQTLKNQVYQEKHISFEFKDTKYIQDFLSQVQRNPILHTNFKNKTDLHSQVYDVILGVGLKRQDGTFLENHEVKALIKSIAEYSSNLKNSKSVSDDMTCLKQMLMLLLIQHCNRNHGSNITIEIERMMNFLFTDYRNLLDFIKITCSMDDLNRFRYAGGFFALSDQSLFARAATLYGINHATNIFEILKHMGSRVKNLKIYELVLMTCFTFLKMAEQSVHTTWKQYCLSDDIVALLCSVLDRINYMIGIMRLGDIAKEFVEYVNNYYSVFPDTNPFANGSWSQRFTNGLNLQ